MDKPIIKELENRKTEIEGEIAQLKEEQQKSSRRTSECQVQIIGLTGEKNAIEEIINKLKDQDKRN